MAKLTLTDVDTFSDDTSAVATTTANNDAIEAAVENTLSRDGTSPNTMEADFDMNSNNILNHPEPVASTDIATKNYVDNNPGPTGPTGATGAAGSDGADGVSAGLLMEWDTVTTDTDQGAGKTWLNHATPSSATVLYMDDVDINATGVAANVALWDDSTTVALRGTVRVSQIVDPTNYVEFSITGTNILGTGYTKVAVTHVSTGGSLSDTDAISVQFVRTGDSGAGTGDVVGPAASTDNSLAKFDGATGKLLKDGAVIGADVQAWDTQLDDIAALSVTDGNFIVGDGANWVAENGATALASIGGIGAATTDTFTEKTFDANASGNNLSNVDVADLANGTDGELITWDAAGAPDTVAVGTATHVLTSNGIGAAPTFQAASGGASDFLLYEDQAASGVAGTSYSAAAWRTVTLDTEVADAGGHGSISSNAITLAAGTYEINAAFVGGPGNLSSFRLRWYNTSDSAAIGNSTNAEVNAGPTSLATLNTRFTIAASKTFELQVYPTGATLEANSEVTTGDVEVYAQVFLKKVV